MVQPQYLGISKKDEALKFLAIGMGGVILALQALIANRRAKAMEDTAKAQVEANQNTEQGQRQERLKNAIEHLGNTSDSVRLGGAYELFHLAEDTKNLRQTVLDILCAHIRRTTDEKKYRETHEEKPSEEIQSLLTLLFVQKHEVFKGLPIHLQGSHLNGAALQNARLENAVLNQASLLSTNFEGAPLQGARLEGVQLQEANLEGTQLQGITNARWFPVSFESQVRHGIGQPSCLSRVLFAGGLNQEKLNSFLKVLSDEEAEELREELTPHVGKPPSHELPEKSGAITGAYTKEEAEQWIVEYKKAMSEVPESNN